MALLDRVTVQVLAVFLGFLCTAVTLAETNESAAMAIENVPDSDAAASAEYRQGSSLLGQQMYGGSSLYGGNSGYQQLMAAASGSSPTGSYGGMLRNLYRPASFGLTDKVKNWVKSFLNRRQYVKPYYNPASLLAYGGGAGEDKPIYINGASYKPMSVPLRQIQKYYKPFYGSSAASGSAPAAESAMSQYFANSPSVVSSGFTGFGGDSGLYASESAPSSPIFSSGGSSGGLFSQVGGASQGLFSAGAGGSNSYLPSGLGGAGGSFGQGTYQFGPATGSLGSQGMYGSSSGSNGLYGSLLSSAGSTDDLQQSSSSLSGGGSSSSLYLPSNSGRNTEAQAAELPSGFSFDSSPGSYPVESTYSLSYQRPPQSPQQYGGSAFEKSSFQPVNFAASDGSSFKGLSAAGSGGHSALYVSEKSS